VGTLLDTSVFIGVERASHRGGGRAGVADTLRASLDEDEEVGIAAITASELLHGVHRASAEHRAKREAFVEGVLAAFPTLPFDLLVARVHARVWAQLASAGRQVGAHDQIIAATALAAGWRVATANSREFERIAGVEVLQLTPP
jgi:tRNA(fMet)-specific endonuclease VapC